MRVVIFFISLFTFLLAGGHEAVASTQQEISITHSQAFQKSKQSKYSDSDQGFTLFEDADLDLSEESHLSDNLKPNLTGKFLYKKYRLPQQWPAVKLQPAEVRFELQNFNYFPRFCGQSPIYITHRVLRL